MTGQPTYEQSIREMADTEPRSPILSPFWARPSLWPQGDTEVMFIGEAMQQVGRLKFGNIWTGNELRVQRRISSFPPFSGSLEFHWEKVRERVGGRTRTSASQTSWDGLIPPPLLIPTGLSREQRAALMIERAEKLESEGAEFYPIYEQYLKNWQKLQRENGPARQRLEWVLNWLSTAGRLGNLDTRLRRVKAHNAAAPYIEAPDGFWNVEHAITKRFSVGHVHFSEGHQEDKYYIFLTRNSLGRCLGSLAPFETPADLNDLHLSPFMRAIIDGVRDLNITPQNQYSKDELVAYFIEKWKGLQPLSRKMAERMATVAREVESQRGAWKHKEDD